MERRARARASRQSKEGVAAVARCTIPLQLY
jgi:hypothetical protein